jgi:hypothetical protein
MMEATMRKGAGEAMLLEQPGTEAETVSVDIPKVMVRRQMNQAGNSLLAALEPMTDDEFFVGGPNGISPAWTVGHLACVMDLFTMWIEVRDLVIPGWMHEVFNSIDLEAPTKTKAELVDREVLPKGDVVRLFRSTQVRTLKLLSDFDMRMWDSRTPPSNQDTLPTYGAIWQALGVHTFWHLGELAGCIPRFHGTHTLNTAVHYFYYRPGNARSGIFPTKLERP